MNLKLAEMSNIYSMRAVDSNASKAGGIIGKLNYNLYTPGRLARNRFSEYQLL